MNRNALALTLTLLLALLVGCGGGGSKKAGSTRVLGDSCPLATNPGQVDYFTTWGSSPATASQVLRILDRDGNSVRTDAINRGGATTSTHTMTAIPPGVYEFKATLYSLADAGGVIIGETSQVIDLCGKTVQVRTTAALAPTSLKVSPGSKTMTEQQTLRFVATALASSGQAVFLPEGAIDWSVLGSVGTVSSDGLFTATTAGTGAVRAQTTSPSLVGASTLTVNDFVVTNSKWTVLVYINAANDLYWASDLNVNQMESVANNPDLRFVLQWKQSRDVFPSSSFDGVRRVLVKPDNTNNIVSEVLQSGLTDGGGNPLDMGLPQTLLNFVNWGKTNFPSDHTILVIWNHGNGWRRSIESELPTRAFSYDDQTGSAIQIWQTAAALGSNTFDIIAWDASLMQMMEVAYEARGFASYIVGSEESPPAEGYPYDLVFGPLRDDPNLTPSAVSGLFVDGMLANPPYATRKITQSSIDTTQLSSLATALSTFAQQLTANAGTISSQVQDARATSQAYSQTSSRYYRDIVDLCLKIEAEAGMPAGVVTAAANVRSSLASAIVWEGHNSFSPNSHGLSIDFSPASVFGASAVDYGQMKFAQDTDWDSWLAIAP